MACCPLRLPCVQAVAARAVVVSLPPSLPPSHPNPNPKPCPLIPGGGGQGGAVLCLGPHPSCAAGPQGHGHWPWAARWVESSGCRWMQPGGCSQRAAALHSGLRRPFNRPCVRHCTFASRLSLPTASPLLHLVAWGLAGAPALSVAPVPPSLIPRGYHTAGHPAMLPGF